MRTTSTPIHLAVIGTLLLPLVAVFAHPRAAVASREATPLPDQAVTGTVATLEGEATVGLASPFSGQGMAVFHPAPAEPAGTRSPGVLAAWLEENGVTAPLLASRQEVGSELEDASVAAMGDLFGANFAIANVPDSVSDTESLDRSNIAYNPNRGEYLVAWQATTRAARSNVYARFVSASGSPLGAVFSIAETSAIELAPSVAYDPTGDQYWVAWTDLGTGSTGDVRVRRLSPTGAAVGSPFVVNGTGALAFAGRVACGASRCIVVWNSDPGDGNAHILARSYSSSGTAVTNILLLSDATGTATEPDIAFNGSDSKFLVVWYELHSGTGWDVMGRGVTPDISAYGKQTLSNATGDQKSPRVAYSQGAGRFFVVWYDGRSQTTWDIYGQLVGRDFALVGGPLQVYAGAYHDAFPVVAGSASSSQFLVAYQRDISGATQFQIFASPVSGSGGVGSSFQVRYWYNDRIWPAIAHRPGTNDYLISFTDDGAGTQPDIEAQIARGDGTLAGSLIAVARGRKGQEIPRLANAGGTGEYLVSWADYRSGSDYDLYARRVSATGSLLGSEVVVGSESFLYGYPALAFNTTAQEYLVVWQEVHGPTTGYEIYARRVGVAGDVRGTAFLVSRDTATPNEGAPRVIYNAATNEYLVVWHAYTTNQWRIWGQRVSPAGALTGANFLVSASPSVTQTPHVALNPNRNEYLVVWQDMRNDGRVDIYGQRLGPTGGTVGANFAISTAAGDKDGCDIAFGATAWRYLVVFGDARTGGNDVYGQLLDGTGALAGTAFAIADSSVAETAPVVMFDAIQETFVVAWWQFNASSDWDTWARKVPAAGGSLEAAFAVSTAGEVQNWPELAEDAGAAKALLVWQDFRADSYDVYGQVLDLEAAPSCSLECSATAPATGAIGVPVSFNGSATPSNCVGTVTYEWDFGDASAYSTAQSPSHAYGAAGSFGWHMTASVAGTTCQKSGTIAITGNVQTDYEWWLPVVSHASGAAGSNWRSDVGLLNRSPDGPATVTLILHASAGPRTGTWSVGAGGQEIVVDLAAQLGLTSGSAALEIHSDRALFVTSRTYNQQPSGLTYGQSYDSVVCEEGLATGESAWLPHLVQSGVAGQLGTYRTNIGLTNTGATTANVTVTLYDANGVQVWSTSKDLSAGEWYQYQEPFRTGAHRTDIAKGYARVTVNSGSGVIAYASVLDNASSDATTITMKR